MQHALMACTDYVFLSFGRAKRDVQRRRETGSAPQKDTDELTNYLGARFQSPSASLGNVCITAEKPPRSRRRDARSTTRRTLWFSACPPGNQAPEEGLNSPSSRTSRCEPPQGRQHLCFSRAAAKAVAGVLSSQKLATAARRARARRRCSSCGAPVGEAW